MSLSREHDAVYLGGGVMLHQMHRHYPMFLFLNNCFSYYQVIGNSKVKNSASLIISLAKTTVDFFIPFSGSTNITN